MNVSELIAKLNDMQQDMVAVVRGYEGGYDDINDVKAVELELNPNAWNPRYDDPFWFYGVYEKAGEDSGVEPIKAVFIEQYDEHGKHREKKEMFKAAGRKQSGKKKTT